MSLSLAECFADSDGDHCPPYSTTDLLNELEATMNLEPAVDRIQAVRSCLMRAVTENPGFLPELFSRTTVGRYARRPLYIDPEGRYSVMVMTWGPGQGTPLHDHNGLWVVECLYQGRMKVTNFDYLGEEDGAHQFRPGPTFHAQPGQSSFRVPPHEHHTLQNDQEEPSITIHVFGGILESCRVFEPTENGYRHCVRCLVYTQD